MCLCGELVLARVLASIHQFGICAGICGVTIFWHACGCKHLSNKFRFTERLIYRSNEERHDCSATCGTMSGGRLQQLVGNQL